MRNVSADELTSEGDEECSEAIAARVAAAREIQLRRFREEGIFTNSQMDTALIRKYCGIGAQERAFLKNAIEKLNLSARAYSRILKLARTIADLEGNNFISLQNITEALQYRNLDRSNYYE